MAAGAAIGGALAGADQPVADAVRIVVRANRDVARLTVDVAPGGRAVAQEEEAVRRRIIAQGEGAGRADARLEMEQALAVGAGIGCHGRPTRL
ncbi:hypothetical protein Swit_4766 [Rhizorhabdus wittichii RW1]|uniref:Uncharacterized protein n=1 Tax=Rhizorhabdus wittichii (strain DSM 6014 / CCUG 31198 / JCM 15750 / NBRC 105917 / EY 4224 / RW1) TaxID=392499 RepID=A0A9J9LGF0_RHIWR|nr:hypothetical protein Swit_4766 [Rhizorhabdus wittichii RW1]